MKMSMPHIPMRNVLLVHYAKLVKVNVPQTMNVILLVDCTAHRDQRVKSEPSKESILEALLVDKMYAITRMQSTAKWCRTRQQ